MDSKNKEIAIKGIALLLKEKAVGIKEISDENLPNTYITKDNNNNEQKEKK